MIAHQIYLQLINESMLVLDEKINNKDELNIISNDINNSSATLKNDRIKLIWCPGWEHILLFSMHDHINYINFDNKKMKNNALLATNMVKPPQFIFIIMTY